MNVLNPAIGFIFVLLVPGLAMLPSLWSRPRAAGWV